MNGVIFDNTSNQQSSKFDFVLAHKSSFIDILNVQYLDFDAFYFIYICEFHDLHKRKIRNCMVSNRMIIDRISQESC